MTLLPPFPQTLMMEEHLVFGDLLPRVLGFLDSRGRARAACVSPGWQAAVSELPPPLSLTVSPNMGDLYFGAISPCGRMIAALVFGNDDDNDGVSVWSTETGERMTHTRTTEALSTLGCQFYEGPRLFTATAGMYTVLVPRTGEIVMRARLDLTELAELAEDDAEEIVCLRPGGDALRTFVAAYFIGRWSIDLFSVSDRFVRVHDDDEEGAITTVLPRVGKFELGVTAVDVVKCARFSPRGDKLVAVSVLSATVTMLVWDMPPDWQPGDALPIVFRYRQPLLRYRVLAELPNIAFSSNGRFLAVGTKDGCVLVFDTSGSVLVSEPAFVIPTFKEGSYVRSISWTDDGTDASLLVCRHVKPSERCANIVLHTFRLDFSAPAKSAIVARDIDAWYAKLLPRANNNVFIATSRTSRAYFERV